MPRALKTPTSTRLSLARGLFQLEEILENLAAALGQDAFRMELNAPDGKLLVPHAHNLTLFGLGSDFETVGKGIALDYERVIAGRGKRVRHAFEKVFAVMLNERGFAMHHPVI